MAKEKKVYDDKDTRLMQKAAMGNEEAREKVSEKFHPIIVDYAASINGHYDSAEDIAQEVFLRLWSKTFDYHPRSSVKTYLFEYANPIISRNFQRIPKNT